ncbi:MAG: lipid-A-disaccharide synthase [Tepidisphaeraceae bacterium]
MTSARIAMVAGEASGDLLGGHLLTALGTRRSGLSFDGIGGPRMIGRGFDSIYPMEKLSVRGYVEVLRHYREIMGIRRSLLSRLLKERPQLFIGIDAPDFNLDLEYRLKSRGIPTVHYVSPSVWAWRRGRVRRIARSVTHMLALFPFETEIYREAGVPVTYVGHPVADTIPIKVNKAAARAHLRLPPGKLVVALLPGSRQSELRYMADTFVLAAKQLHAEVGDVQFLCPTASRRTRDLMRDAIHRNEAGDLPITLMFGHSHEALAAADLALVASGTATLETALLKTPMVIVYKMSPITWKIMRRMLYLPYVGLPNILAGEFLVDEFMQDAATPEALSGALLALMRDTARQGRQVERFAEMHETLRQDNATKAAEAVLQVLDSAGARGTR